MRAEAASAGRRALPALWAAALFIAILAAAVALLARLDLPNLGAWTGIRPVESKLDQLERFAAKAPVDALVLGSSIVDFGFSAELFSRLMSAHLGREYRAYNFATGGAEPRTLARLYRLARIAAVPRSVIVMAPPEPRLPEKIGEQSPDFALMNAPAGAVIDDERRLRFSRWLWHSTIARSAPAIRQVIVRGNLRALADSMGMDAYALDAHGDRVSYLIIGKTDQLALIKQQHQMAVRPFPERGPDTPQSLRRMAEFYFASTDSAALEELAELVRKDGGELHLVSHAGAASLWGGPVANPAFEQGRADFYKVFAALLGARFHDPVPQVTVPLHAVSDTTHLNVHGAEIYTREVFTAMTGKPAADPGQLNAQGAQLPDTSLLGGDATSNAFAAVLRRPAGEAHPLLRFRLVDSLAVPRLPSGPLEIALRLPGRDDDLVVPAAPIGAADYVAEIDLPASAAPQALLMRLRVRGRPLRNPIASYEWITSFPREPVAAVRAIDPIFRVALWSLRFLVSRETYEIALERARLGVGGSREAEQAPAGLQVMALPPLRHPGQALYIALRQDTARPAELAVRLRSLAPRGTSLELGLAAPMAPRLLRVTLPASLPVGEYEVTVTQEQTGQVVRSAPVHVVEP